MSYLLAFLGFAALIVLHEFGHYAAAKAVGMRVERFSLFFGPMVLKRQIGETVYGIGVIPLGGYVKITGMSPEEVFETPSVEARAYTNMPVWKRVVVIAAGPAVNLVIAFAIFWGVFAGYQQFSGPGFTLTGIERGSPAARVLEPGDQLISVGGARTDAGIRAAADAARCPGVQRNGCTADPAIAIVVRRDGRLLRFRVHPRYESAAHRPLFGFDYTPGHLTSVGLLAAAGYAGRQMWFEVSKTAVALVHIIQPKERRQLHSVVGIYAITQQQFSQGASAGLFILGGLSLALAVFNLLPFLPLDGGHIFWAVAEKLRRRRISLATIERASFVGLALMLVLVGIGLSNDVPSLLNGTLHVH